MEKIRIKNKDLYKIEVNDAGEFIEFDLADIGLPYKCYQSLEQLEIIKKETLKAEKELRNKIKQENDKDPFSENNKKLASLEQEAFKKMRKAMDNFLGENACQKIFGDRNYFEMFDDLIKEFSKPRKELNNKSHFDMLNFRSNDINRRIAQKYNKSMKRVI